MTLLFYTIIFYTEKIFPLRALRYPLSSQHFCSNVETLMSNFLLKYVNISVFVFSHVYSILNSLGLTEILQNRNLTLQEGNGTPLQYSCLENPVDGGAWKAAVHGVTEGRTRPSDFPFTFHFHALEKEMATHSSVLAWRIPGTGEPGGLPSMGSQSQT